MISSTGEQCDWSMFWRQVRLGRAQQRGLGLLAREEGGGQSRDVDGGRETKTGGDLARHGGGLVVGNSLGGSGAGVGAGAGAQAVSRAEGVLALVDNGRASIGPDVDAGDVDVLAGDGSSAKDDNGAARSTVGSSTLPVGEGQVLVLDTATRDLALSGPGRVDLEGVGVAVTDEVLEARVLEDAITAVVLDHHHLVGVDGVDVAVGDVGDGGVSAEGADSTAARPVAEDVLDKNVAGLVLDSDAEDLLAKILPKWNGHGA